MSAITMAFIPGMRYQFRPRPTPGVVAIHTKTLTYLRDCKGDGKVIHHIFQWKGGALECFTDEQMEDFIITKK